MARDIPTDFERFASAQVLASAQRMLRYWFGAGLLLGLACAIGCSHDEDPGPDSSGGALSSSSGGGGGTSTAATDAGASVPSGCEPGAVAYCSCDAGGQGTQVCDDDGAKFSACACN
jgi:hypothetical protein